MWEKFREPSYTRTVRILIFLILITTVPLTVYLAQNRQDIRQRASELSPSPVVIRSCDILSTRIKSAADTLCENPNYDSIADVNKNSYINTLDFSIAVSRSNGFTDEAICAAFLADTKNPCRR